MKTTTKWILAALTAAAAFGCDPFQEAVKGPPALMSAGFTSVQDGTGYDGLPTAPGVVPVVDNPSPVPSTCMSAGVIYAGDKGSTTPPTGFIFAKFNKPLDGYSIQTSPTDCKPAAALNLAVTSSVPIPALTQWYACYNPQAPSPDEGGSVIIFLDHSPVAPATAGPTGWDGALSIPADGDLITTLHATGTVHDQSGTAASFDVTVDVMPDPGTPGALSFSNITSTATATDYDIGWAASKCAAAGATYTIQRAPDNASAPGTPGTFADLATGLTVLTYHDSVTPAGAIFWYRVRAVGTGGPSRWTAARTPKPAAPAAPTFANWTATSVDVNWTATASAVTYNVQRAPDVSNAPGTFADLATGLTGLTYTDASATTKYWYRIVAVNPYGSTNGAYASQVPAQPAVPTFSNVTTTTLDVTWKATTNAVTYTLQRALDASGNPGTWANIATGLTITAPATTGTFPDTGLTTGTRYWYRVIAVNPSASTNGVAGFVNTQ